MFILLTYHATEVESCACVYGQHDSVADSLSRWFAAEIIGNVLDIEPRRWRRPRKIEFRQNKDRVKKFKQKYDKFDWTGMIERS